MLEAKKYRQYAKDCVRIAASMSGKDRQTLLDIAKAWEACAVEAESKSSKSDGGRIRTRLASVLTADIQRPAITRWRILGRSG